MVRGPRPPRASQRVATLTAERALAGRATAPLSPNKNQRLPPLFAARLLSHNEGTRSATLQQWP